MIEEVVYFYLVEVVVVAFNFECADDGVFVADGDCAIDVLCCVGIVDEQACAHEEFVVWCDFEIECFAVELFSAEFA